MNTLRMLTLCLTVLLAAPLLATGANAQNQYAGQWQCEMANYTVTNNRFENWTYSFILALYPNGGFEAQGSYFAETNGFSQPFVAQGYWSQTQDGIVGQGQQQMQAGGGPFVFNLVSYGPGSMSYRTETLQGRLAIACQR